MYSVRVLHVNLETYLVRHKSTFSSVVEAFGGCAYLASVGYAGFSSWFCDREN